MLNIAVGVRARPKLSVPAGMLRVMTNLPPVPDTNYSPKFPGDTRTPLPFTGAERAMLVDYLDYYRATVELKCRGVPKDKLNERSVPPSTMTLHGLIRHLAGVEQWWFHYQFAGDELTEHLYYSDDWPDQDFEDLSGGFDEALATWRAMCDRSRAIVAAASLDDTGTRERTGEPFTVRSLLLKMITEYARHSGQADLLREAIDGATGE